MSSDVRRPRVRLLAPTGQGRAEVIIRCPRRLERMLSQEFVELKLPSVQLFKGGAQGLWTFEEAELACFSSRLASRVLWPLARFPALNADDLYSGTLAMPWGQWLIQPRSLGLGFDGVHDQLRHTRFSALRVKDAIFDRLRQEGLPLPELDPAGAELQIHGVLHREQVTLYMVLGGGALHRRGWRRDAGVAPIKENLAAAILRLGGWGLGAEGPLLDPVCGSGTLLVEGALMALGIAPGASRARSGHDRWVGAERTQWAALRARSRAQDRPAPLRLIGRDADREQLARTQVHLEAAGLWEHPLVELDLAEGRLEDYAGTESAPQLIVGNPPYGARLAASEDLLPTLGRTLTRHHPETKVSFIVGVPAGEESDTRALITRLGIPGLSANALNNGALEAVVLNGTTPEAPTGADGAPLAGPSRGEDPLWDKAVEAAEAFANRIRKNRAHFGRWARRQGLSAYRLYDRDLPEYVLTIDHYGTALAVQTYEAPDSIDPAAAALRQKAALALLPDAAGVKPDALFHRERRRTSPEDQYGVASRQQTRVQVIEGPAKFLVNVSDYLDTGLYLDSRGVRRAIAEYLRILRARYARQGKAGPRFLNLFSYTGTATVQGALGGAEESLSVDLSRTYLNWARENFQLNGLDAARHSLQQADVKAWLLSPPAGPWESNFDVILFDAPTFSNSERMDEDLDLQRDHGELLTAALKRLAPGGVIFFVTHARRFQWDFAADGWEAEEKTHLTLDQDCDRGRPPHRCWLIRPEGVSVPGL